MANNKKHLEIDLDFLDKEGPQKPTTSSKKSDPQPSSSSSSGWKKFLIFGGIALFICWTIYVNADEPTSTSGSSDTSASVQASTADDDMVINGEYRCSSYDSNKADALIPTETRQRLDSEQNALDNRSEELDGLKSEIDDSDVTEDSSQYEIDNYNEMVDGYNLKLGAYKRDSTNLDSRIDQFNAQVERHNNYLIAHCTKI